MALLALAAAVALWLLRDLPRAQVERALAERLGAAVTVRGLALEQRDRVRLDGVEIRFAAGSAVRRLVIDRVIAEGPVLAMADGHFASLALSGVRARVEPCGGTGDTDISTAPSVDIGTLQIEDGTVNVICGERSLPVTVNGTLLELGGTPHGRLEFLAAPVEPLTVGTGVRVAATGLAAEVTVDADGKASLHATAQGAQLLGRAELALGDTEFEFGLQPRSEGGWRFDGTSTVALLGNPALQARVDSEPWRIRDIEFAARHVAAGALLDAVAPVAGLTLGPADVMIHGESPDQLEVAVSLPSAGVTAAGQAIRVSGSITGRIDPSAPAPTGRLRATLSLSDDTVDTGLRALLPATVDLKASSAASGRVAVNAEVRPGRLGALTAHGTVGTAPPHAYKFDWSVSDQSLPQLAELAAETIPPAFDLAGTLGVTGRVEGTSAAAHGTAVVVLREVGLGTGPDDAWHAAMPSTRIQLRWGDGRGLQLTAPPSELHITGPGVAAFDGLLTATTTVDLEHRRLDASELTLDLADLGMVTAGSAQGVATWQVDAQAPDLGAWLEAFPDLNKQLPEGGLVTGSVEAAAQLTLDLPALAVDGHFEVHDAGWTGPDFQRVVEGLQGRGEMVFEQPHDGSATVRMDAEFGGFQVLWGALYGDYTDTQAAMAGHIRRHPTGDWDGKWHGSVGQLLDLQINASGQGEAVHWRGTAASADLKALWEQGVRQPCAGSLGGLEELRVRGGSARIETEGRVASRTAFELHTVVTDLGLAIGDEFEADGFHLDLPVALVGNGGHFEPADERHGEIAVAGLRMGGVTLPGTRSTLTVEGDDLRLDESLSIPLFGGMIEFDGLGLRNLLSSDRHLEAAVELNGLEIEKLTRSLGFPRLEGRLEGHFPNLRLSPGQLRVDGTSELSLFGGSLILYDISGDEPLSRYPRLSLAMAWENIDLGRLTGTFDFGSISGIAEGEVEHCELFRAVPVRCSAWLQTTPDKNVKRRISMKAVNNIAIVGTGSGFGLLNRGIHRFIDSYSYETLGFSMKLKGDHFLLRGLANRGDKELFVKGRLPLRLDVVNAQPGTTVSFNSMLERLRHLDFQAVRTEP